MKKSIFIVSAAALVVLAACNKEISLQVAPEGFSLDATVEQQVDPNATKTALDGASVVWAADDAIKVFDEDGKAVKLTADAAGTSAHFSQAGDTPAGFNEGGALYAIYPYADGTTASGSTITFTLPATQTYVANSFDPACNVSVGQVAANAVTFKNTCGLLKLQLKGVMKVGKIELTSKTASQYLSGTFTVDATAAEPAAVYSTGGSTTLTLDCDDEGGVQLNGSTATVFYFVVPATVFGSGFTAKVYDVTDYLDTDYQVDVYTTSNNSIVRSRVRAMPTCGVSLTPTANALPEGYKPAEYLTVETIGGYIDIDVIPTINTDYEAKLSYASVASGAGHVMFGVRSETSAWMVTNYRLPSGSLIDGAAAANGYSRLGAIDNTGTVSIPFVAGKDHIVSCDNDGYVYLDGVKVYATPVTRTAPPSAPLYVFAGNHTYMTPYSSDFCYPGDKLYYLKLSESGVLTHNWVPCKYGDSIGLYDMINAVFKGATGTGSLTCGNLIDADPIFYR